MPRDALSLEHITDFITSQVRNSPVNRLSHIDGVHMFDAPLVGVADGDDPLFIAYKKIIGPHHLLPGELLASVAPRDSHGPSTVIRVICWVLPISEQTRRSNAEMTAEPSRRWSHTRHYGELFNDELRRSVEDYIRSNGGTAIAPAVSPLFKTVRDDCRGISSTWSERHAMYAAGLGTFGLCDGFLTPVGKAMRCGSVVTDVAIPTTPRHFQSHTAACPFLERGLCGECMSRCPARAISPNGHDKNLCERYQHEVLQPLRDSYGVSSTGCGLCQTGVPCEQGLPAM